MKRLIFIPILLLCSLICAQTEVEIHAEFIEVKYQLTEDQDAPDSIAISFFAVEDRFNQGFSLQALSKGNVGEGGLVTLKIKPDCSGWLNRFNYYISLKINGAWIGILDQEIRCGK